MIVRFCQQACHSILLAISLWCVAAGSSALGAPANPSIDQVAIDRYMQERLAKDKYPSLSIGVVHDQNLIFARAYGLADIQSHRSATPETIYRIGSVTKVFTATLMCILRDQGIVRLDDPVARYLPEGVRLPTDPRGAPAITLRHLATHSSGLPRLPDNLSFWRTDPYDGYSVRRLYASLGRIDLIYPTGAGHVYSNLGMGLLGHALALAAGQPYEDLLSERLLNPLRMTNTAIHLSPQQQPLYATGYASTWFNGPQPVADWDLGCIVGAGGLASNVPDLAKFLSLQMRQGQADVTPVSGGTLTELHTIQRLTDDSWHQGIALGWMVTHDDLYGDCIWHNGRVAGHTSYVAFLPKEKIGVIVLANYAKEVDDIGDWLLRMIHDRATSTSPDARPADAAQSAPATGDKQPDGSLEIIRATYGAAGTRVDVTSQIRQTVKEGQLSVLAGNHLAGDPSYGTPKTLEVEYRLAGQLLLKRVPEGEILRIPEGISR